MRRFKKQKARAGASFFTNNRLFLLATLLTVLGLIAIADASGPLAVNRFSDRYYFVKQQSVWAAVGIFAMFIVSRINYKFWEKIATPLFFVGVFGLLLVFLPGIGTKVLGARRWVNLGFTTFQPSELVKLATIIYLAKVSAKEKKTLAYFVPVGLVAALIMLQPDLGTTLVIVATSLSQIFISGINLLVFFSSGMVGAFLALILILTSSYRKARLMTFLQQADDPLNKGYHIRQILLALGSGGFFGVGLGASRQKFLFLPETATDSIFAVVAEEVGFFGSSLLLLLIVGYLVMGFRVIKFAPDRFSRVLATGIVSLVGSQAFLNIASMVALVPLTGVPLPFISFGGTSLVIMLVGTGILINISNYGKQK